MIDPTEMELAAMASCLVPLGEYVGYIGMHRPLAEYSKNEVLMLINVVVTAYQEHMVIEHEQMTEKDRAILQERLARQGKPVSTGVPF